MSMRTQLALWYSGLLTVIIIIFGIAVITVSRLTLLSTVDQVLTGAAEELVDSIDLLSVAEFSTPHEAQVFFASDDLFSAPGVSVQVWRTYDNDGQTINPELIRASDDIIGHADPLDPNMINREASIVNSINLNNAPVRVLTRPFIIDGQPLGLVQVASPLGAIANSNDQLLIITIISAVFCIGASLFVGQWLSDRLLNPIKIITEAAASIANAEDLSTRIEWQGEMDELGELTQVFNHMMERLERLFSVQQRFIGDVSHELRTPLTSIIGHLELIERYGYDEESLNAIQREANRMSRMVNDLLLLTRADFGELEVDFYTIDLDTIALEVYEQAMMLSKGRELKILLYRVEPVQISGNADRIRQLMLNLLGNAIKFTSDGGTITLGVYQEGGRAIIEVSDTGIGIAEGDLKRIFDRFFQADTSRVQHAESDGAGLGLSIVRWIVDIHGGVVDVQSKIGEGTQFKILLPLDGKPTVNKHETDHQGVTESGILRIRSNKMITHQNHEKTHSP